eukprot:1155725-Pleurochrysis_carterae.AAC.4
MIARSSKPKFRITDKPTLRPRASQLVGLHEALAVRVQCANALGVRCHATDATLISSERRLVAQGCGSPERRSPVARCISTMSVKGLKKVYLMLKKPQ